MRYSSQTTIPISPRCVPNFTQEKPCNAKRWYKWRLHVVIMVRNLVLASLGSAVGSQQVLDQSMRYLSPTTIAIPSRCVPNFRQEKPCDADWWYKWRRHVVTPVCELSLSSLGSTVGSQQVLDQSMQYSSQTTITILPSCVPNFTQGKPCHLKWRYKWRRRVVSMVCKLALSSLGSKVGSQQVLDQPMQYLIPTTISIPPRCVQNCTQGKLCNPKWRYKWRRHLVTMVCELSI
jgi:hypothetical protein